MTSTKQIIAKGIIAFAVVLACGMLIGARLGAGSEISPTYVENLEKRANRLEEAITHPHPTDCVCAAINATKPEDGVTICHGNLPVRFMCECVAGKSVAGIQTTCGK